MRFRLAVAIVTVLVLCRPGTVTAQKLDKKPAPVNEIGGRKLEAWIGDIASKDRSKGEIALGNVLLFGPDRAFDAVPAILKELNKHGPTSRLDTSFVASAASTLGEILGRSESLNPQLLDNAVALLTRLLGDRQSVIKHRAAEALGQLGPRAQAAARNLIRVTEDIDAWDVRLAAVAALGTVGGGSKDGPDAVTVSALCKALTDDASQVRLGACRSLLMLGPPAKTASQKEALAALATATRDAEPAVRLTAHVAILRVKGKPDETQLEAVGNFLGSPDPLLRRDAAEALGTIGPEAKSQVPRLIAALDDKDGRVVSWAMGALGQMGKAAAAAVAPLKRLAADPARGRQLQSLATETIELIQGKGKTK